MWQQAGRFFEASRGKNSSVSPWFRVFSFSQFFRFGSSGVVAVIVHRLKLQTAFSPSKF